MPENQASVSDQIAEGPRTRVIHILAKERADPKCGTAWVAHALELDLVAVDDGEWQAISKLATLIQMQIDFGVKNNNEAHIHFPAPPEYFAELPCSAATRETRGTPHDAELMKWKRALHSLTPGGSEFANDPDACVNFVKNVRTSQHNYILKLKKENDELRRVSQPVAPPPPPNEIEHLRRMVRLLCDDGVNLEYCRDLAKRTFHISARKCLKQVLPTTIYLDIHIRVALLRLCNQLTI
jgi:hypothetical protein